MPAKKTEPTAEKAADKPAKKAAPAAEKPAGKPAKTAKKAAAAEPATDAPPAAETKAKSTKETGATVKTDTEPAAETTTEEEAPVALNRAERRGNKGHGASISPYGAAKGAKPGGGPTGRQYSHRRSGGR